MSLNENVAFPDLKDSPTVFCKRYKNKKSKRIPKITPQSKHLVDNLYC